jgi:hypothetical protein
MAKKIKSKTSHVVHAFISHNKADKEMARSLAIALIEQGADVWFDEWNLRPGDSLIGGIEAGLASANVFIVLWSKHAKKSSWIRTEMYASLCAKVADETLRIVPVMLDKTALPHLLRDHNGFSGAANMVEVAAKIVGKIADRELMMRLQERFFSLTQGIARGGDPLPYRICPNCGSENLERSDSWDFDRDDHYYLICCKECKWQDGTEV